MKIKVLILVFILLQSFTSKLNGHIIADPNHPSWLIHEDGSSHFLCGPGDPEGFLYRGVRQPDGTRVGDQSQLINKLVPTGANGIYLIAMRSNGGDGSPDENPFIDSDPTKMIDKDILNQWEEWFTQMDDNGIVIYLFFYDDGIDVANNLGWRIDKQGQLHPQEKYYIETIVNSFKHHKNIQWIVMEEVQEMGSDYVSHAKKIAELIKKTDEHKHAVGIHKLSGLRFEEFADDPNIDQFSLQYTATTIKENHDAMVKAWNYAKGRYNLNFSEPDEDYGTFEFSRKRNWAVAMGGAYIMPIGWDIESTNAQYLEDCGRLVDFMESTDFNTMAPHDELAFGETEYVLADPGKSYVMYSSNSQKNLGLKNLVSGTYSLKWFDNKSGYYIDQEMTVINSGNIIFKKPDNIGREVALHLKKNSGTKVFPGKTWDTKTPSEIGMNEKKLKEFEKYVKGNGFISKDGYQVYKWGAYTRSRDVSSASKPIYVHYLFKALENGIISSLNDKVIPYAPELNDLNKNLGFKDRNITWKHLGNQISCYGVSEHPGECYNYSDWQMALFFDTLFLNLYGSTYEHLDNEIVSPMLTDLIGCEDDLSFFAFGTSDRAGRLMISPRDFARIGLLYLNNGNWDGVQILRKDLAIKAITSPLSNSIPRTSAVNSEMIEGQRSMGSNIIPDDQTDHEGSYSWLWWINGVNRYGIRMWPDAPLDTFGSFGHSGRNAIIVIPGRNVVISWNNSNITGWNEVNTALAILMESLYFKADDNLLSIPQDLMWLLDFSSLIQQSTN